MATRQFKLAELDDKFKVKISSTVDGNITIIEAPLPAQFGLTVGSEFSSPFDAQSLSGVLQKFKIPGALAGGISRKVGVVTTKFYSNPEPTEISFEVEFNAEYSARHEVVEPALALMNMSLGDAYTREEFVGAVNKVRDGLSDLTGGLVSKSAEGSDESEKTTSTPSEANWYEDADNAMSLIGLIEGPETVKIRFGNVYELSPVWVSSVTTQFSNVVDAEGMPLSCTCNVTAVIQRDPVRTDMNNFFGVTSGGRPR